MNSIASLLDIMNWMKQGHPLLHSTDYWHGDTDFSARPTVLLSDMK